MINMPFMKINWEQFGNITVGEIQCCIGILLLSGMYRFCVEEGLGVVVVVILQPFEFGMSSFCLANNDDLDKSDEFVNVQPFSVGQM